MMNFTRAQIFIFLMLGLWTLSSYSQNYYYPKNESAPSDQSRSCGDFVVDSGGPSGNYNNNESFDYYICPEDDSLELVFTMEEFSLGAGDELSLFQVEGNNVILIGTYYGNSINWSTQTLKPGNCLRIKFISDGAGVSTGWRFGFYCSVPADCQEIVAQLDSSVPAVNSENIIRVCSGEDITLNGSGQFENDGSGASYEWDLGDGRTMAGQSVTYSYDTPGIYVANLKIHDTNTTVFPEGCPNYNQINQIIQVGTIPDFAGTEAETTEICLGQTVQFTGMATPITSENVCTPPVSGVTYLPDPTEEQANTGNLPKYSSCISVECFDDTQKIQNASDLLKVCINMEHSYAGDVTMRLISPNGSSVLLFNQGGNDTYLGNPIDNDDSQNPGTGLTYCFTFDATTLLEDGQTQTGGSNPPDDTFVPGDYKPLGSFDSFIGSPFNGNWCLEIVDNLYQDNGFIFEWSLQFDPNIVPEGFLFTPEIVSSGWDSNTDIISSNGDVALIQPSSEGTMCYTYRVVDDFGCEYTQDVCINVVSAPIPTVEAVLISTYFSDNNIVEVRANGPGSYEYSIDGGNFQASNRFTRVAPGIHLFTARDIDGCGENSVSLTVLDYPRVFTPNGDGRNETWNIPGLSNQPSAKITIYDRFGKLLKQISPSGQGWNGTFNGNALPATDYWFTLEYNDPDSGQPRLFKSHFALRR